MKKFILKQSFFIKKFINTFLLTAITISSLSPNILFAANTQLDTNTSSINKQNNTQNNTSSTKNNTPNGTADEPKLSKEEKAEIDLIKEEIAKEIDEKIIAATDQLKKIDTLLEELAQIIQNGLAKTGNKVKLTLQIKSLRKFISKIVNDPLEDANLQTINFILILSKHLAEKIKKSIKDGLKNLPDIDSIMKELSKITSNTKTVSVNEIIKKLNQNDIEINLLEKTVQRTGLTWVNLAYRNFVYAPAKVAQKLYIPTIATWTALAAIVTTYALYRTGKIKKIRKILGRPAEYDSYGQIQNEDKVKTLGWLENSIYQTFKQPIAKILFPFASSYLVKEYPSIKRWAKKKLETLHYQLMGGTYEKSIKGSHQTSNPRFTFKDVVGMENVKKDLKPLIEFIKNPARFERVGIGPEKGYLFAGKPGTGKSFMAEALAGEIAEAMSQIPGNNDTLKFIPLEASEVFEIISENGVNDGIDGIMSFAKKNAPCIVFIDEPDLLGLQRTTNKELLSKLLNAMNGYLSSNISENVILLAATNRPDNLDPALLRRGRLGKIIYFEYPTYDARKDFLEKKLNPIVSDINDFDIDKLARETEGATFEGIQSMVRRAFQDTKIKGEILTQKVLERALNDEIRQILPESKDLSEKEIQIAAASQAACALANLLLETPDKLACVTINPVLGSIKESSVWDRYYKDEEKIIQQGKIFTYKEKDTSEILTQKELLNNCKILLAENAGQEIIFGNNGQVYNKVNSEKAMKIAMAIATNGTNTENMPKTVLANFYNKALQIIEDCKKDVRQLLEKEKDKLEKIYKALLAKKTLDIKEIKEIIKAN